LPPNTEEYKNGLKIVTEYGLDDDNRKFKVVRTYKIEKRYVAKAIAQRKSWPKFGLSKEDKPGPNPATTIVSEDVAMQVFLFSVDVSKPLDVN
jgi:translation initiation factor 3 subunit G